MRRTNIISLILLLSLGVATGLARDYKPSDLKNPNVADRNVYISDPEGLVSPAAKNTVNNILSNLRQNTTAEVVMAVVPNTGSLTVEDFSTELFTEWGIGKKDRDNGVLILIALEEHAARIATGYGAEGIIPDISARKIIERSVVPYMKENDLDGAVTAVAKDVANVMSSPEAAEELRSRQADNWNQMPESDITAEEIWSLVMIIVISVFFVSMGMYFYDSGKLKKQERYTQALAWHEKKNTYLLLSLFSLGLGLIPYFLVTRKYKKARNSPMKCPTCRGNMKKLNEEEDNYYLNPSQDFEEKLDTVDYDVWVCPDCGTIERYPFRKNQMKYEECPNCHTIAMCLVRDHTLQAPTVNRLGLGERIYECQYCHNRTHRRYSIPKKNDGATAAILAGGLLGSGRGGGGFGGGIGGGFGGGSTGGGGATGRW